MPFRNGHGMDINPASYRRLMHLLREWGRVMDRNGAPASNSVVGARRISNAACFIVRLGDTWASRAIVGTKPNGSLPQSG